jgi:regulator of replication initiation timing
MLRFLAFFFPSYKKIVDDIGTAHTKASMLDADLSELRNRYKAALEDLDKLRTRNNELEKEYESVSTLPFDERLSRDEENEQLKETVTNLLGYKDTLQRDCEKLRAILGPIYTAERAKVKALENKWRTSGALAAKLKWKKANDAFLKSFGDYAP